MHPTEEGALSIYVEPMQHVEVKPHEEFIKPIGKGKQKWKIDVVAPFGAPPKPTITLPHLHL